MIAYPQRSPEPTTKMGKAILAAVLAILIALGVFQRIWTDRAVQANNPEEVKARLQRIPLRITTWEGQDETSDYPEYPPTVMGPIRGIRYVNRSSGETVRIFLTAGPVGPILVNHLPTDCYPALGYELVANPVRHTIACQESSADFWVCRFTKADGPAPSYSRVYWAFTGSGDWQAPQSPRLAFARYPTIYKLYVVRSLRKQHEPLEKDPANEFIRDLVPVLRKTLFLGQEDQAGNK